MAGMASSLLTGTRSGPAPGRKFPGVALFVDIRGSTEIGRYITRKHGAECRADLFGRFLDHSMELIVAESDARCEFSGDAVRATMEGADGVERALLGARAVIRFARDSFEPASRRFLDGGHRRFRVGAGIDCGDIVERPMAVPSGHTELYATSIDRAAKVSGLIKPNSIGVTSEAFRHVHRDHGDKWHHRFARIGGELTHIRVTIPDNARVPAS